MKALTKPVFSIYTCRRLAFVSFLHSLETASVTRIIKKFRLTGSVANLARSGRPTKLSEEAKAFIDQQMRSNDEMTSAQIRKKLAKRGVHVSSSTVRRSRKKQG